MDIIPGKVGIWTFDFDQQPMAQVCEEVAELEALGYGAIWIPEVAGREALTGRTPLSGEKGKRA